MLRFCGNGGTTEAPKIERGIPLPYTRLFQENDSIDKAWASDVLPAL